jgi:hypothetical protein
MRNSSSIQPGWRLPGSFPLRLPSGQSLRQPILKFRPPFLQRAIEEIISHVQPALFVLVQLVDITVFEYAGSKRKVFCVVVEKQRTLDELASVKTHENAFASKIELLGLKAFAVYDALFV